MHKTKVSRAVRALADRRWLARRENTEDRREEFLRLTPAGLSAYKAILPAIAEFEARLAADLGAADMRSLVRVLERLEAVLGTVEAADAE
jgi:DNA-binding MarR family transcriptional regulator